MPPSFPLIPTSAQGDPFCTDSFCQDNSGTDNDVLYYTSRYQYVRFRAVWTIVDRGVIETWPLRFNPGRPVFYSDWYFTQGTTSIFLLNTPFCDSIAFSPCSDRPPANAPYPFGQVPWLINYTGRFAFNGTVQGQTGLQVYRRNSNGDLLESIGGTAAYFNTGVIGDLWASIAGTFEFTNGPLINTFTGYPRVISESEIVSWQGLPLPSTFIYR